DDCPVLLVLEEGKDAYREHRTDAADRIDLFLTRLHQSIDGAKSLRQQCRGALADMANSERIDKPRERPLLTRLDRRLKIRGTLFAQSFQVRDLIPIEVVNIRRILQPA